MSGKNTSGRRLTIEIGMIIVLLICLAVTTLALVSSIVSMENDLVHTGIVKINLNDEKPVIQEHEFLFEPGMTVEKPFFIQNEGTCDVYYRLYFENVEGGLADYLKVTILDGDQVLYQNTASAMTQKRMILSDNRLRINERRDLTIRFYFPPESGNAAQDLTLSFVFSADAVQTKNNPNKLFE